MPARFTKVRVELRSDDGDRVFMVEVDRSAPLRELLPDLVKTLPIDGDLEDFELNNEGTLDKPILVLTKHTRGPIGDFEEITPDNE